jgi:hypothetical protein
MNFLKKVFGSKTTPSSKDDASIKPVSSQVKDNLNREPKVTKTNDTHDDIEPIVKQTVEILFKNVDNRKKALKVIRKYKKERDSADLKTTLALLKYSDGDVALLEKSAWQSHPHFWMDEISPIFRTIEAAENWANSLSELQSKKDL